MRRILAVGIPLLLSATLSGCLDPASGAQPTTPAAGTASPLSSAPTPSPTEPTSATTSPAPATSAPATGAGPAVELLQSLPVKGRAPRTGYSRSQFGQSWADVDRNGCDTRNDVLRRDLTGQQIKPGTNGCKVIGGVLADPYSGTEISLGEIQVDHVVALSDAWQKGAQALTSEQRLALANDPLNLQPTLGRLNQQKSDSDAASWLPPARGYRCDYVARQVAVKAKYSLWVTEAERSAIDRVLAECPGQDVPENPSIPAPRADARSSATAEPPATTRTSAGTGTATRQAAAGGQCDPSYPTVCIPPVSVSGDLDCAQITDRRFTVLAPDPHNLDGNHDGVGCEGP